MRSAGHSVVAVTVLADQSSSTEACLGAGLVYDDAHLAVGINLGEEHADMRLGAVATVTGSASQAIYGFGFFRCR